MSSLAYDHPDIEKISTSVVDGQQIREIVRLIFRNLENGTPDNISQEGCLALAQKGHEVWNEWRRVFPCITSSVNRTDFSNRDYSGLLFRLQGFNFGDFAMFDNSTWNDESIFNNSTWGNRSTFDNAHFGEKCSFIDATWGAHNSFKNTEWGFNCLFNNASWGDHSKFSGAKWGGFATSQMQNGLQVQLFFTRHLEPTVTYPFAHGNKARILMVLSFMME